MNAFLRMLAIAMAMLLAQSASAAPLSIAQYPLFLTHRTLPNVLVIYDNSESMDATMAGKLIAGDDPTTRGNIARAVIRNTITNFSGQFNWGLESFATYGYGLYSTYPYWLGNDTTMVFTDDCVSGISATNGGLRCIENPQWAGSVGDRYVTYDRASDDPDINDVLYIGYFGPGAWATTAGGGAYNFFFTHNPGTAFEANMANYWTTLSFTPTDAGYIPYNPPISRQLYAYRAWGFYGGVNGQGVINEPILGPSSPGHLANIQALLASETPYGPEIKNAAVFTPLAGSMLTANQYFTGGSSPISLSCQKSFIMLATDGNPTSDWWGNMYPLDQQQNVFSGGDVVVLACGQRCDRPDQRIAQRLGRRLCARHPDLRRRHGRHRGEPEFGRGDEQVCVDRAEPAAPISRATARRWRPPFRRSPSTSNRRPPPPRRCR